MLGRCGVVYTSHTEKKRGVEMGIEIKEYETKEEKLDKGKHTIVCLSKSLAEWFSANDFNVYLFKLNKYTKREFEKFDNIMKKNGVKKYFTKSRKVFWVLPKGVEIEI